MKKLMLGFFAIILVSQAHAVNFQYSPPDIGISRSLKELSQSELTQLEKALTTRVKNLRGYLDLTGEPLPKPPDLVPLANSKLDIIPNIQNLQQADEDNSKLFQQVKALANSKSNGIKLVISDIHLENNDGGHCQVNPVTETLYQGEVHSFTVSCTDNEKVESPNISTMFFLGYGADLYLHVFGSKVAKVDILSTNSASASINEVPNYQEGVKVALKLTYKPF